MYYCFAKKSRKNLANAQHDPRQTILIYSLMIIELLQGSIFDFFKAWNIYQFSVGLAVMPAVVLEQQKSCLLCNTTGFCKIGVLKKFDQCCQNEETTQLFSHDNSL